jgi:serine/threonine protein kinase
MSSYYFMDMELCDFNLAAYIAAGWIPVINKGLKTSECPITPRQRMEQAFGIMLDVTNGIEFIHRKKKVHRDLKPRNSTCTIFGPL